MKVTFEIDDKVIKELMEKVKIVPDEPKSIRLRCIESRQKDFTVGKTYCMEPVGSTQDNYILKDDDGYKWKFYASKIVDGHYYHNRGDFEVI